MQCLMLKLSLACMVVMTLQSVAWADTKTETATFAGGCFWCMEPPFEKLDGVKEVISGYTGGFKENPTYDEVSAGGTGHLEAVQVIYDPAKVSYSRLLDVFWRQIDPTDAGGQFVDRGAQYRSAIFFHSDEQRRLAEQSKEAMGKSGRFSSKPIVTEILPEGRFYRAEGYHQDYYKENPIRYKLYRYNSGRDQFLNKVWPEGSDAGGNPDAPARYSKPADGELKKRLTPMQYKVTQKSGTEPAYDNEYWDNKRDGIYVDIVSGEPLFSSTDKYDSHTGWPSFTKPIDPQYIMEKDDWLLFTKRTELSSRYGRSHLGHVFDDGPKPAGARYCINSAAMRFIPKEDMQKEGYGEYLRLFDKK